MKKKKNPMCSLIPKDLVNPYEVDQIQTLLNK